MKLKYGMQCVGFRNDYKICAELWQKRYGRWPVRITNLSILAGLAVPECVCGLFPCSAFWSWLLNPCVRELWEEKYI